MWEVFNMGCGFVAVVPEAAADEAVALLAAHHPGHGADRHRHRRGRRRPPARAGVVVAGPRRDDVNTAGQGDGFDRRAASPVVSRGEESDQPGDVGSEFTSPTGSSRYRANRVDGRACPPALSGPIVHPAASGPFPYPAGC